MVGQTLTLILAKSTAEEMRSQMDVTYQGYFQYVRIQYGVEPLIGVSLQVLVLWKSFRIKLLGIISAKVNLN